MKLMLFLFNTNRRRRMINSLFLINMIFFFLSLLAIKQADVRIITVPLTHHHSFSSPTYNRSQTITDRAHFDFHSSIDRAAFYADQYSSYSPSLYLRSRLTAGRKIAGFLADIEVGSQGLKQQVVMDTGSGLLWINCVPSDFEAPRPLFDPASSTSYRIADCNVSAACRFPGPVQIKCRHGNPVPRHNVCRFYARYGDDTTASGKLFVENFKFENNTQVLHDIVFGCSTSTTLYSANGILGLSRSSLSILRQNKYTKFSYCIGNVSDQSYSHNKLIVGDIILNATTAETPIISAKEHHYYINLEAIFFDSYKLDFDPAVLRRDPDRYFGGMIVDSGSTYTFLRQVVYDKFEEVVVAQLEDELNYRERNYSFKYKEGSIMLCYDGVFTDLTQFPTVIFQFEGGAEMRFGTNSVFQQVTRENFCLAVMPTEWAIKGTTISILGNLMQQFSYMGFDLVRDKLAFQQDADCSLIG